MLVKNIGMHRISGIRPDIRLNTNIEFFLFSFSEKIYLHLVFDKSAYRSLLYIDIISSVKTIFDFKQFF